MFKGYCLPKGDDQDFNGSGGAYFFNKENLYLKIGTPTSNGEKINMLAQDKKVSMEKS